MAAGKKASGVANKLLKLLEEPPEKRFSYCIGSAGNDSAHYPKPYPAHECTED
jgi:hypothetical protein